MFTSCIQPAFNSSLPFANYPHVASVGHARFHMLVVDNLHDDQDVARRPPLFLVGHRQLVLVVKQVALQVALRIKVCLLNQ